MASKSRTAHTSNRLPIQRRQLVARRREHTLARHLILDQAQTQVWLRHLRAVNRLPQAHSGTLASRNSNSLRMVCPNNQHMASPATWIPPHNSKPQRTASLLMASRPGTSLLKLDTLSNPLLASKVSPSSLRRWVWVDRQRRSLSRSLRLLRDSTR